MPNNRRTEVERLAGAFAALANPQRLRMFIRLAASDDAGAAPGRPRRFCCATELGAGLNLAGSTVSHHLKELRQSGLVHVKRHGRQIDCWASPEMLDRLSSFFAERAPGSRQATGRPRGSTGRPRGRAARGGNE